MDFITAIRAGYYRALDFEGRARRSEFWWFSLFFLICLSTAITLDAAVGTPSLDVLPEHAWPENYKQSLFSAFGVSNGAIASCVALVFFIPLYSLSVRRLHNIGWSGYWALGYIGLQFLSGPSFTKMYLMVEANTVSEASGFLAFVAALNLAAFGLWIYIAICDSESAANAYGPSPKGHS